MGRAEILRYAKENAASFKVAGASSNEIRFFECGGAKYVLKTPLERGENLSPFWRMMKRVFNFSFERQHGNFENVYDALSKNPHIPVPKFVAADNDAAVFEFAEGESRMQDDFPDTAENARRLGLFVGFNHQARRQKCGIFGAEDCADFFAAAKAHIEKCIGEHWNGDEPVDKKIRAHFGKIKGRNYQSAGYSLVMADISADQFLYDGGRIAACVDLDAYVAAPVEWELSLLKTQVRDWASFKAGYETYQPLPEFETLSGFFFLLMALNSYNDKSEIDTCWHGLLKL